MAEEKSTQSKEKRPVPRWVWILASIVLVVGLVAGVSAFYVSTRKDEATAPAPASQSPAAVGGADGCIAGRDNDAASLIEGARKQPHTEDGAAATAAGFMRFMLQYPWASEKELASAFSQLSIAETPTEAEKLAKGVRANPGPETARTAGFSFADARYVIEPSSTKDEVQVSIAAQAITDGTVNGSTSATTFTMAWGEDVWTFVGSDEQDNEKSILDNGTAFLGGC